MLGCFLPDALAPEEHVALDERARADKQRLLECHATQRSFCRLYPLDVERFRLAPAYDFTRPPAAPFHYDRVAWGVNGEQFLRCVQSARRAPSEASC